MWQSVARFFSAAFNEFLTLERQRRLTIGVLIAIMVLAAALIAFIAWADFFYA